MISPNPVKTPKVRLLNNPLPPALRVPVYKSKALLIKILPDALRFEKNHVSLQPENQIKTT